MNSHIDTRWLPMVAALAVAFGYFAAIMYGKVRLLFAAQHRSTLFERPGLRLKNMFVYALGQKKMFKEIKPGLMHAFIFWGFLVLQIRTIYLISLAFIPDGRIPFIHNEYAFIKDVTELLVLAMLSYAAWRRLRLKPKRLTLSTEALVVLGMIGGLIVSDFFVDAFMFARLTATDAMASQMLAEGAAPVGLLSAAEVQSRAHVLAEMNWAFVGSWLAGLFSGLHIDTLRGLEEVAYWTHIIIVLTFLNMLPGSKHFHVITSLPNVFFGTIAPKGAIRNIEHLEQQEEFGVGDVARFDWSQMLDLYSCTECGRCSVNCPTTITGKVLNPKKLITDIRDHLYAREASIIGSADYSGPSLTDDVSLDAIWDCTTCRACSEACPVMIEHVDKIVDMRRHLVLMEANFPKELGATLKNLNGKGNPWGLPKGDRAAWADGLEVPHLSENPDAEYVFWVGCAGAYDDRQKKVSKALVRILNEAGVSFAILGKDETCTGDPARRAGEEYLFQTLAQENVDTLNELGLGDKAKKLVTHCPHCFNTIKNEYPQFGGNFEIVHHSTLIDRLLTEGKLKPRATPEGSSRVTYHDSCYIGRYNDIYEEPRNALQAIPGLDLKEMARNRTTGMCCGAGGARVWMEEHRGERVNQERVKHALETKADTIAVACPFCNMMMGDGVKELGQEGVKTRDIAELIADSL